MSMKFVSATFAALLLLAMAARAQTTAFTYQGRLNNGTNPATGMYDFRFQIYNANSVVVGGPLTNAPVGVTNGLFTVALDFGGNVFNGSALTLEIGVRTNGDTNVYTVLSPRQPVLSVPYAVQSLNASNALTLAAPLQSTNITGTIPDTQLSANVALLNTNQVFAGANKFTGPVTATNPANVFVGAFAGNGIGLTSLSTTNLVGTLPDARLSTNVALLNASAAFSGTVSAGLFAGNGHGLTNVPGAFFWVTISGTNAVAASNVGFIVTNNTTPVTILLPPAPSVGDVFRVAGVGAAGWIMMQNSNQTVLAGNLSPGSIGENWTARDSVRNWSAVASSSDGVKLVATVNNGQIYTSTNSGQTWTAQTTSGLGSLDWSCVASSADGTKLVAAVGYIPNNAFPTGFLYTSTDSGVTWTKLGSLSSVNDLWSSVASSANGSTLVAAVYGTSVNAGVYSSINAGANWTFAAAQYASAVASSADGTKLVVTVANGAGQGIYTSTNSGASWVQHNTSNGWTAVTSSSDGSRLAATMGSGQIYISADSGVTWTPTASSATWTAIDSSADGSLLAATYNGPGYISISTDSGALWSQRAPNLAWDGIALSSDGTKLAAVAYGGQIYTSSQSNTSIGTTGYLTGAGQTAIELEYVGNGIFLPLSHEGTIRSY